MSRAPFLSRAFFRRAWPQTSGTLGGLPLDGPVEVLRDSHGIPHIQATTLHDVFCAQGFVHAQDRLWQMESLRRLSEGRLSEIAGEGMLGLDYLARLIGLPSLKRQTLVAATDEERAVLRAYEDGVNAYLGRQGKRLPLEFSSMGFTPEPWTARDALSPLPYLAWFLLFSAYCERILAIAHGPSLTEREWNDLFRIAPGVTPPEDHYFDTLSRLKLGRLHPAATAFHMGPSDDVAEALPAWGASGCPGGGSNSWVFARGADGAPLLANDPHLAVSLPPVWYFCHLCVPGVLNVAGGSIAGIPGIVIGRNEHVAWGLTNVMLDAVDALLFRVDPSAPARYAVDGGWRELEREDLVFGLPKGKSVSLPLYRTVRGPVITAVENGIEAIAVLRWAGTLPDGMLKDRNFGGQLACLRARTVAEVLETGRGWAYLSQNLMAADDAGHIGWHATGAVPIRNGYAGRLPADGTAGADWIGFVPYDSLPHAIDPPRGWIATANYRPDWPDNGRPLSYTWCTPYRHQRIVDALSVMDAPCAEDFRRLQMDVHSLQADRILARLLTLDLSDPRAAEAAAMLGAWNHEVTAESAAAAVYEVFLVQLERELLGERLGRNLALYQNARLYGIIEEILDLPDSPFWRRDPDGLPDPVGTVEAALVKAMDFCAARMGNDRRAWAWGRLHRHAFRHPGATSALTGRLLNPRPFPAAGDAGTLNVSWFAPTPVFFDVTVVPSLRMVTSLAHPDSLQMVGPLGQSGQPGHAHYNDMTEKWNRGEMIAIPLTRPAVDAIVREKLVLKR